MNQVYIIFILFIAHLVNGNFIRHQDEVEFNFLADSAYTSSYCQYNTTVDLQDLPQHLAGYLDIKSNSTIKGRYFYTLIENRYKKSDVPFLLWSNGGPGRSSLEGLFFGNGPYFIQDDLSLCWSEYGWDKFHGILFIDYPLDVGFSYSIINNTDYGSYTVPEDILQFLYLFFERHPELECSDFYMSGLSFAGHYLPSIGDAILKGNKENKGVYINLKGMELGNPAVNPSLHGKSIPVYAYKRDIITKEIADDMLKSWPECDRSIKEYCDYVNGNVDKAVCVEKLNECFDNLVNPLYIYKPDLHINDIRGECYNKRRCTNLELMSNFLNMDNVKERLNVSTDIEWLNDNEETLAELFWLIGTDFSPFIENLLDEGLRILVDAGTEDLNINWIGTEYWMEDLDWEYKNEWNAIEMKNYSINGNVAGKIKSGFDLTFATVNDSGHWVVEDQPDVALSLILNLTYENRI